VIKTDPRAQNPWKIGLILLLAGIAIGCAQHKVPTILIPLMEKFDLDAFAASWLMSILVLVGVFLALPLGKMIQRWGFKPWLLGGLILLVVGTLIGLAAGFLVSPALLFVSRGIEGIGLMVVSTCAPTAVAQCVRPDRQGLAMGLWSNWGAIGGAVGMATTPFIWSALGYSWVWSLFIIIAVVAIVLIFLFVDDPQPALLAAAAGAGMGPVGAADGAAGEAGAVGGAAATGAIGGAAATGAVGGNSTKPASAGRYREVLTRDTVLVLYAFICFSLGLLALLTYLPSILQLQGIPREISALPITLIQLLSMICVPICGAIYDKTGRAKPLLMVTLFTFGAGIFLMFTSTGPLLWGAAALEGIVGFSCIGMFLTAYSEALPRRELMAMGMGVFILVQSLGQFLGSAVVQMLLGPDLTHWVFAGACVFAIVTSGVIGLAFARFR
jgi:MFS family permease